MLCFCFAFCTRQESKSNVYKATGLLFMTSYLLAGMAERFEVAPGRQSEHNLQQERGFQVFFLPTEAVVRSQPAAAVWSMQLWIKTTVNVQRGVLVARLARIAAISNGGV